MQRIVHLEIQFVLASGNLVVTGLDHNAHLLERARHLPASSGGKIGREIEIATAIVWEGSGCVILEA